MSEIPALTLAPLQREELLMERHVATTMGHATQQMVTQGWYTNARGQQVDIAAARDAALHGQRVYAPGAPVVLGAARHAGLQISLVNQTTLTVAQARVAQGYRVAILNFASATSPGGGWLYGSRAQEESLARSSALVHALQTVPWYADERHQRNPFYDDTVIVTPGVPFFRTHTGELLDAPWQGDVITSAAVQAKAVYRYLPERASEITPHLARRIQRIYEVATTLDADVLILGAWGCGAFGNDAGVVARLMHETLDRVDMRRFAAIDFAVADLREPRTVYDAFAQYFG